MTEWKVGDWVIYDMGVNQIVRVDEDGNSMEVTCGVISTFGNLKSQMRPLTIENKRIGEGMKSYYKALDNIDGHAGFNYPDIHRYFNHLALEAMDGDREHAFEKARDFLEHARNYKPIIDGIRLFRRS